jgi:hypothetical protein
MEQKKKKNVMHQKRKKEEIPLQEPASALAALLNAPFDPRQTKRILEIRFPVLLYVLVDERNCFRLIGRPELPGGHFQVGKLDSRRKEWYPATQQDGLIWESKQERDCVLHQLHRRHGPDLETALVQHNPTYTRRHGIQVVEFIERVEITPLWDTRQAYQTITCGLLRPCGCSLYQSLLETKNFQWG